MDAVDAMEVQVGLQIDCNPDLDNTFVFGKTTQAFHHVVW
jgi:hypothetical protein